jgi:hypothetical protein
MDLVIENRFIYWNSKDSLPNNLEEIISDYLAKYKINDELENINGIIFNHPNFNHPIINLPNWIQHIIFIKKHNNTWSNINTKFNQPLDYLPSNLILLELNLEKFDHSLDYLPSNLQELKINITTLRDGLENTLLNNLPPKLRILEIVTPKFNWEISNLPNSLKILKITCQKVETDLRKLPISMETIIVKPEICYMPQQFDLFNYLYTKHKKTKNLQIGCFNFFLN